MRDEIERRNLYYTSVILMENINYNSEVMWLVCCNCEQEISIEEIFCEDFGVSQRFGIECPTCGSMELRHYTEKEDDYGWY